MPWNIFRKRRPLPQGFGITAIISVFDDGPYLARCFENMKKHQIRAIVIDNDCCDETRAIVEQYQGDVVQEVVHHPRDGTFDWSGILRHKEAIANRISSDWIMLWDSDEIREPPQGFDTFRDAIRAAHEAGHTAVNFDEFVFLPIDTSEEYRFRDYVSDLKTYYYFAPKVQHRITAWARPQGAVNLQKGLGHSVKFRGLSISPTHFAMRHYLFLSHAHGKEKYLTRTHSQEDTDRNLSAERRKTTAKTFKLPPAEMMKVKSPDGPWDTSDPQKQHPTFVYDGAPE
jgi:glycosyltransferase involved in cell wall biosynthesis